MKNLKINQNTNKRTEKNQKRYFFEKTAQIPVRSKNKTK